MPHSNNCLIGHEEQEKVFLDAFLSNKMHHSWIIHGPEGIGKTTLAYRIARFLIANVTQDAGFLNEPINSLDIPENSNVFRLIASKACPDLLVVAREFDKKTEKYKKEIVVEDVRKVNDFMHKTSSNGNYRVVIVDEADKMNRNSQNAILKILEEPPAKTIIILVANNIGAFLPTIKSRCRSLKLDTLSEENVLNLISKFCPEISEEDKRKISLLSEGSIGNAIKINKVEGLKIYEDLLAFLSKNLDTKTLHSLCDYYGVSKNDEKYQVLISMLDTFLSKKIMSVVKNEPMVNIIGIEDVILDDVDVKSLLKLKENIEKLISNANVSNLDRSKVLLYIFSDFIN